MQKAIQQGHIQSWDDPVMKYLPELQGPYREELKLRHLSNMTAGLQWNKKLCQSLWRRRPCIL
ncbi:MAG: serine hydrolase [Owenweeksia sp.]|nr:serine hydrolase [Owenweeksia sp.]